MYWRAWEGTPTTYTLHPAATPCTLLLHTTPCIMHVALLVLHLVPCTLLLYLQPCTIRGTFAYAWLALQAGEFAAAHEIVQTRWKN